MHRRGKNRPGRAGLARHGNAIQRADGAKIALAVGQEREAALADAHEDEATLRRAIENPAMDDGE